MYNVPVELGGDALVGLDVSLILYKVMVSDMRVRCREGCSPGGVLSSEAPYSPSFPSARPSVARNGSYERSIVSSSTCERREDDARVCVVGGEGKDATRRGSSRLSSVAVVANVPLCSLCCVVRRHRIATNQPATSTLDRGFCESASCGESSS
jgi:hypothetical protein